MSAPTSSPSHNGHSAASSTDSLPFQQPSVRSRRPGHSSPDSSDGDVDPLASPIKRQKQDLSAVPLSMLQDPARSPTQALGITHITAGFSAVHEAHATISTLSPSTFSDASDADAHNPSSSAAASSMSKAKAESKTDGKKKMDLVLTSAPHHAESAKLIKPGEFDPENHFYPRVINAQIHPMVSSFLSLGNERIAIRYCHLHPRVNPVALRQYLAYQPKYFRWAG